jgi:hypothetical protein
MLLGSSVNGWEMSAKIGCHLGWSVVGDLEALALSFIHRSILEG